MTEDNTKKISFKIKRYNPEQARGPSFNTFEVPFTRGMTVLDGLTHIKENLDSTLAFRSSCRMGICGSCALQVNNYPYLACHTQVEELGSDKLIIKPLPNFPVIKDLVPDLGGLFEKHIAVKPYIIRGDVEEMEHPTAEFAQTHEELDSFLQFTCCVQCGICTSTCPTTASDKLFLGAQALVQCYHYCADNRDDGEAYRLKLVDGEHGVWQCHLAGACSEACPKGVDPALGIQLLKRRLIGRTLKLGKVTIPAKVVPQIDFIEFNKET